MLCSVAMATTDSVIDKTLKWNFKLRRFFHDSMIDSDFVEQSSIFALAALTLWSPETPDTRRPVWFYLVMKAARQWIQFLLPD